MSGVAEVKQGMGEIRGFSPRRADPGIGKKMAGTPVEVYQEHFVEKGFERLDLFLLLRDRYGIRSAIYPGSFVHITP